MKILLGVFFFIISFNAARFPKLYTLVATVIVVIVAQSITQVSVDELPVAVEG
jgi:hypothetical protein